MLKRMNSVTPAESRGRLVLFLGADWWGSDGRALAMAFRQSGHALIEVDDEDYFSHHWSLFPLRVLRRLGGGCSPGILMRPS